MLHRHEKSSNCKNSTVLKQSRDFTLYQSPIDVRSLSSPCLSHEALPRTVHNESWRHSDSCCMQYAESSGKTMPDQRLLVSVVDDDASVRESLPDLLGAFGFAARVFSSPEEFLESGYIDKTRCLILDISMPGMTGPDLQQELKNRGEKIPIVFITANGDESIRRRLLETGAVDCLFKPFRHTALREALNTALGKD